MSTKKLKPYLSDQAMAYGIEIIEKSFIQTEAESFDYREKDGTDYVVFTSSNAVKAVLRKGISLQSKKIGSTSGETKKLLTDNGIHVDVEGHDARSLALQLLSVEARSVVFFCGNLHRDELPALLKAEGVNVDPVIVYSTVLTPSIVNEPLDGILFFSPSAVDSFLIHNTIVPDTHCFCIGQTTASHLASKTAAIIHTATLPSQEKLIDQLIEHYTNERHAKK